MLELKVKAPKVGFDAGWEGKFDFGDTLGEAVDKFGEDVVFSLASSQAGTNCQNACRVAAMALQTEEMTAAGENPTTEDIIAAMEATAASYVPGVKRIAVKSAPSQGDILASIATLDPNSTEFAALVAALQAKADSA